MKVFQQLASIEQKVQQLATSLVQLRKANDLLEKENKQLKKTAELQDIKVKDLAAQLDKTRGVLEKKRESDPESTKQLRQNIAQYIEVLDKCIEQLHNS